MPGNLIIEKKKGILPLECNQSKKLLQRIIKLAADATVIAATGTVQD